MNCDCLLDICGCFLYFTGNDNKDKSCLCASDAGASAREREDMELLEQALEKALKVRAGNGPSKKDSKTPSLPQKETQDAVVRKEGPLAPAPSKGKHSSRSASKSASSNRTQPIHSGTFWSFTLLLNNNCGLCSIITYRKPCRNFTT